jgi:hypothetical protein
VTLNKFRLQSESILAPKYTCPMECMVSLSLAKIATVLQGGSCFLLD